MTLDVRLFPCLTDNYGLLIRDQVSGHTAAIDTPDADAILAALRAAGWERLDWVLNTHWHPDHTGGNAALKAATGCTIVGPEEVRRAAPLDQVVRGGDRFQLGETAFEILDAPGHTLGHLVWHAPGAGQVFVGDVMFVLGCGRLFEGTAEQMWNSLQGLAALPDETVVWCAHEYTASNARFALTVDGRAEMKAHCEALFARREAGEPTVPTTIGIEKAFNPFVRATGVEAFAALRSAKDGFSG